jgi:hypothetical protein
LFIANIVEEVVCVEELKFYHFAGRFCSVSHKPAAIFNIKAFLQNSTKERLITTVHTIYPTAASTYIYIYIQICKP